MTTIRQTARILMLSALLSPATPYAGSVSVTAWTKQTLLNTFTLNHNSMDEQLQRSKTNYLPRAWSELISFFGDNTQTVRNNKLNLHPKVTGPGQIISSGDLDGVAYWNIEQPISIPELDMNVTISVVVIKANKPPFLIQSVNMTNL